MKTITTLKITIVSLGLLFTNGIKAQPINEGFDNIANLPGAGWFTQNNSSPVGVTEWFQGNDAVFTAYNGPTTSYIGANFNNTAGVGTISNWLVTPNRTFKNGDVISFYTRCSPDNMYPDRLQLRLSTNGASTNVGTLATDVGDFTTLLLDINPTLITGVYPYTAWTQYSVVISGLPAPTSGRAALRYFVTNAGPSGLNSDYIGIDNFIYTPYVCPTFTLTPNGALPVGTAGTAYSNLLTQSGAFGTPTFTLTGGALPTGLTLATNGTISGTPTATGIFNFNVTVSDASGCTGSGAYSIEVTCPANPTSLAGMPSLCTNDGIYTLVEGSPSGGIYSGTGVSAGTFDPSGGTQLITYDYTDAYGCAHSTSATLIVNPAPSVTQSPFTAVCADAGTVALSGGMPAGGTYSGIGVAAGNFDPSQGTQMITYTYTDGNGCSNMATETMTVNSLPTVTQSPFTAVCADAGTVALSGGMPAGGSYSGTGVAAGNFDPAQGTQMITYTYTDGNGCSNMAMETMTVNSLPNVSVTFSFAPICSTDPSFALSGGAPTGGTYSGIGITAGVFDPATAGVGTHTITYDYTDGNGCSASATDDVIVNDCLSLYELNNSNISVYPNPSSGVFTVTVQETDELTDLNVSDLSGRIITNGIVHVNGELMVEVTDAQTGVYVFSGKINGKPFAIRLMKE